MSSRVAIHGLALALAIVPQHAPRRSEPAHPVVIPLGHLGGSTLRTVRVRAGGDTLDFLFDTGNGTMLLGRDVVARTGCRPAVVRSAFA